MTPRLIATPLAAWEREGFKAALVKAKLPADDVDDPHVLVWRFEAVEGTPVGFGGLELFGSDALLRSLVTLPPVRQVAWARRWWRCSRPKRARSSVGRSIC